MTTVTIQEMRFEFARVKAALERGEEMVLTYRGRPLARIHPIEGDADGPAKADPAVTFADGAEELGILTNEDIDAAIYG